MGRTATLFVADNCSHCDHVKPRVVELFNRASITLEVRKARLSEIQRLRLQGFPSLLITYATPPVLIAGRQIPEWLERNREVWDADRLHDGHNSSNQEPA